MKSRGIIFIDYEFTTISQAAEEEKALKEAVEEIARRAAGRGVTVKYSDFALKDRRGDSHPKAADVRIKVD